MNNCKNLDECVAKVVDHFNVNQFKPLHNNKPGQKVNPIGIATIIRMALTSDDTYWSVLEDQESSMIIRMNTYGVGVDLIDVKIRCTETQVEIIKEPMHMTVYTSSRGFEIERIDYRLIGYDVSNLTVALSNFLKQAWFESNPWLAEYPEITPSPKVGNFHVSQ